MPTTAHITPKGYNFGQGGYASFQRIQLPGLGTLPSPTAKTDDSWSIEKDFVNFRQGVLVYWASLEVPGLDETVESVLKEVKSKGKDIKEALDEAKKTNWGQDARVQSISEKVTEELTKVQDKAPDWLASISKEAAKRVSSHVPNVVSSILSELKVPVAGDLKDFGTRLVAAVKATVTYWNTRDLDQSLRSGEPKIIVDALRKELGQDALQKWAATLASGAKAIAGFLTAGASSIAAKVLDTIAGLLGYLWKLYKKIRDHLALNAFKKECDSKMKGGKAVHDAKGFGDWLAARIKELPIVAAHCLASTLTGSYNGFLSTFVTDTKQLKDAFGDLSELKKFATDYVKAYPFQFTTSNRLVKLSLDVIQNGGVDQTNGAAAQSVSWWRKALMKKGVMKKTVYSKL